MAISCRDLARAKRLGTKLYLKSAKFIPMLLRPEYIGPFKGSQQRDIYLERIGSENVTRVDIRAYQRAKAQHRRRELGHRMCLARYKLYMLYRGS